MTLRAVLFDVDFTLVKPGPDLGPEGYQVLGRRFASSRAVRAGTRTRVRPPWRPSNGIRELDHDEEVWVLFTERIIRGMGGDSERAYECALEMTRAWEHAENFEDLYEDTLPVLVALRDHGLRIALVSNTGHDLRAFVAHHALDVDAAVGSGAHGKTKPHPAIFLSALGELGVRAEDAAMVGDSPKKRYRGRPRARDASVPRRSRKPLPGGGGPVAGSLRLAGRARPGGRLAGRGRVGEAVEACSASSKSRGGRVQRRYPCRGRSDSPFQPLSRLSSCARALRRRRTDPGSRSRARKAAGRPTRSESTASGTSA